MCPVTHTTGLSPAHRTHTFRRVRIGGGIVIGGSLGGIVIGGYIGGGIGGSIVIRHRRRHRWRSASAGSIVIGGSIVVGGGIVFGVVISVIIGVVTRVLIGIVIGVASASGGSVGGGVGSGIVVGGSTPRRPRAALPPHL